MGYIKVKHRKILQEIDNRVSFESSKNWNNFVDNISRKYHNLIIKKAKNKCICTNCKGEFYSNNKVNEYQKCPKCKNRYLIKRENLKHFIFQDTVVVLDKVNEELVIRLFDVKSNYDCYNFKVSSVEYARILPFEYDAVFVNDRCSKNLGYMSVWHLTNPGAWRVYRRCYRLNVKGFVYYKNLKQILKNTEYKYSMIWELAKVKEYFDIQSILKMAHNSNKMELLIKAKLYNLALVADKFHENGSFEKIFKVPKTFYNFMKKYDITYKQLELLRILKEEDIKKIRYLEKYPIDRIEGISKYVSINRFIKYAKLHRSKVDTFLFKDYLNLANIFGYDLKNNRYAFPKDLKKEHDKLSMQYKIHNEELLNQAILKRCKKTEKNIYKDKKYIILPAPTVAALEDESEQQHNCVRSYAEDYAAGLCDIYFMRDLTCQNKSLVTVEVKNNIVVQSRIKYNELPNESQIKFLNKWEKRILKGVA